MTGPWPAGRRAANAEQAVASWLTVTPQARTERGAGASREPSWLLQVDLAAASITALRRGDLAPEPLWTPAMDCRWALLARVTPGATKGEPSSADFVDIVHRGMDLVGALTILGDRAARVMAWTHDQVPHHPRRSGTQWTRVTLDDACLVATTAYEDLWVSRFASASLQIEVADVQTQL